MFKKFILGLAMIGVLGSASYADMRPAVFIDFLNVQAVGFGVSDDMYNVALFYSTDSVQFDTSSQSESDVINQYVVMGEFKYQLADDTNALIGGEFGYATSGTLSNTSIDNGWAWSFILGAEQALNDSLSMRVTAAAYSYQKTNLTGGTSIIATQWFEDVSAGIVVKI